MRGRCLQGRLQICRVKVFQRGKGFANGEKVRLVLRDEMFRDAVRIVFEIVVEIKTAITGQLAEDLELAFAGLERGADVIRRELGEIDAGFFQSLPRKIVETIVA